MNQVLYSSARQDWKTPAKVYADLNAEFLFTLDPCPRDPQRNGLLMSWEGQRVYCNPPYGRGVIRWLAKATEADVAVYLLPARTDTQWWHEYALRANEIRFLRGRLLFGDPSDRTRRAPFPSVVLVFEK